MAPPCNPPWLQGPVLFLRCKKLPKAFRVVSLANRQLKEMGLLEVKHGLLQIAESLDFLHNHAHLIHRAISPENVFITLSGAWKLGGFGFAISASQNSGDSSNLPAFHYADYTSSLRLCLKLPALAVAQVLE